MTSERRRAANRENALNSTGPKSQVGRERVSQNARKHGLTNPPPQEYVRRMLEVILSDPQFEATPLLWEGRALAESLAEAEAQLMCVGDAERRLLQVAISPDRLKSHLTARHEETTERKRTTRITRLSNIRGPNPQPVTKERHIHTVRTRVKERHSTFDKELRRLLRYRKAAEVARRRALREWIRFLSSRENSKTKPSSQMHASSGASG